MSIFYAKSTNGFYDSTIFVGAVPADAVEITAELWSILTQGQSEDRAIVPDANGYPVLQDPRPPTMPEAVTAKKSDLAAYRYNKEVGGLTLANGMMVATDDRSKGLIAGARLDTMADPTILTDWKADTGWIQIDADTVAMIATAVAAHVRSCFTAERAHCAAIDALAADPATITAGIVAYDITTGWPT